MRALRYAVPASALSSLGIGLCIGGLGLPLAAQGVLLACGYHALPFVYEQIPSSSWAYQDNSDAMALWNRYIDIYRFMADNGSYGINNVNEFAGWPTNSSLQQTWGFSWGPNTLALTMFRWSCQCCQLQESDIAFNPAYTWTNDPIYAETNSSVVHYTRVLLHELGHSWGEQTINETYNYDVPTVMHSYYPYSVHPGFTIHADDAYLVRSQYSNQAPILPLHDMGVFSHYSIGGLHNSFTRPQTSE